MARKKKRLNLKNINTIEGSRHDKVKVVNFTVRPVKPKRGQRITVNMEIKNVTSKTLKSVPWRVGMDKKILHSGIRFNVPAGDMFKIIVTWTANSGEHFIYGDADPDNVLREPKIKQFNNLPQGIDVKVK